MAGSEGSAESKRKAFNEDDQDLSEKIVCMSN